MLLHRRHRAQYGKPFSNDDEKSFRHFRTAFEEATSSLCERSAKLRSAVEDALEVEFPTYRTMAERRNDAREAAGDERYHRMKEEGRL